MRLLLMEPARHTKSDLLVPMATPKHSSSISFSISASRQKWRSTLQTTTAIGLGQWLRCRAPTEERFPVRGQRLSPLYPFIDGEVRYAVRHEFAQRAVDVIARRTRLSFLNAQAALESLPNVIDLMADELKWDSKRKEVEWKDSVHFLASMGLPKSKLEVSRNDVETGKAGFETEYERKLYSRHGVFPF